MTAIAVVSTRRGVGKTELAEKITRWLTDAGFDVQFVKRSSHEYALAGKDNERVLLAGARRATTVFTNVAQTLEGSRSLQSYIAEWDGVTVVEGFREESIPKIVVARSAEDLPVLGVDNGVVAVVAPSDLREKAERVYPAARFFTLEDEEGLRSWLVEKLGRSLLAATPRKGCRACGFESCSELLKAVAAGREKITKCVGLGEEVSVRVNSRRVFLTKFPADVIKAVCTALVSQLRLRDESIRTIEIRIRVRSSKAE